MIHRSSLIRSYAYLAKSCLATVARKLCGKFLDAVLTLFAVRSGNSAFVARKEDMSGAISLEIQRDKVAVDNPPSRNDPRPPSSRKSAIRREYSSLSPDM